MTDDQIPEVDDRPRCPHCGGPMNAGVAFLCRGSAGGARLDLPPSCPSRACLKARDEAALERAIAEGVIDR